MNKVVKAAFILLTLTLFIPAGCKNVKKEENPTVPAANKKQAAPQKQKVYKVDVGTSVFKGSANAPVTIINFSDFQCPFSKRSVSMINSIMKKYDGKVKYVFKHFPLGFHKLAKPAALAAIAANKQGKFWEYYSVLFDNIKVISNDNLIKWAEDLKLDMDKFETDRNSAEAGRILENDMALGRKFGVRGTPTIFVNGHKVVGADRKKIEGMLAGQIAAGERLLAKGVKDVYSELVKDGIKQYVPPKRSPKQVGKEIYRFDIPKHAPIWGTDEAAVTLVLVDDFECPFCYRLYKTYEDIKKEYGNKIRIAFINLPLKFHKKAKPLAIGAMAAHRQNKFWEMYDIIFSNKAQWKKAEDINEWFVEKAKELKLDIAKFKKDLKNKTVAGYVDTDIKLAKKIGIRGTPGTLVNGRFISGSMPLGTFKRVIDEEIEKAMPLIEKGLKGDSLYKELTKDGLDKVVKEGKDKKRKNPFKKYDIKLSGKEPWMGNDKAPVTIIEFTEHQCPFCKKGSKAIKNVVKEYGDKVKLVFKHLPLSFHKQALPAALFTIAVKNSYGNKKFFEMSELLFENQREWKKDHMKAFEKYSKKLGLDWKKIEKTMKAPETKTILNHDMSEAATNNIKSVPAFIINGKLISGAKKDVYFKAVIDKALKAKKKKK